MKWAVLLLIACGHSDPIVTAPVDAHVVPDVLDGSQPCNSIPNQGTAFAAGCSTGVPPQPTGGPILDGTYVLTAATEFVPPCTGQDLGTVVPTTLQITGTTVQSIDEDQGAMTYTLSTDGQHTKTVTESCPQAGPPSMTSYSMTATGFKEFPDVVSVLEWTRIGP